MDYEVTEIKTGIKDLIKRVFESEELDILVDVSEFLGKVSTTYGLMKNIYQYYEIIKFNAFIKQLFYHFHSEKSKLSVDLKTLDEYFNNPLNIEHMSQIIDSSLHSQSIRCSAILGSYAGGILLHQKEIEYHDKVVINALKIMNDRDLLNFIRLYQFFKSHHIVKKNAESSEFRTINMEEEIKSIGIPRFELELTIEKLKSVQAIGYEVGGFGSVGNAWGAFVFNEISDYLYQIIIKTSEIR